MPGYTAVGPRRIEVRRAISREGVDLVVLVVDEFAYGLTLEQAESVSIGLLIKSRE